LNQTILSRPPESSARIASVIGFRLYIERLASILTRLPMTVACAPGSTARMGTGVP